MQRFGSSSIHSAVGESKLSKSLAKTGHLVAEDYDRIQQYGALPRACILKNLIKNRRMEPVSKMERAELNWVSNNAALYSANPIKTVIEDQIEYGLTQSRGGMDYNEIIKHSLFSSVKSQDGSSRR
jgi:hypothetical protein